MTTEPEDHIVRPIVRFTVDILMPEEYAGLDLNTLEVEGVRISRDDGVDVLHDIIQATSQEARVALT